MQFKLAFALASLVAAAMAAVRLFSRPSPRDSCMLTPALLARGKARRRRLVRRDVDLPHHPLHYPDVHHVHGPPELHRGCVLAPLQHPHTTTNALLSAEEPWVTTVTTHTVWTAARTVTEAIPTVVPTSSA